LADGSKHKTLAVCIAYGNERTRGAITEAEYNELLELFDIKKIAWYFRKFTLSEKNIMENSPGKIKDS
jgi:hypothetical protein